MTQIRLLVILFLMSTYIKAQRIDTLNINLNNQDSLVIIKENSYKGFTYQLDIFYKKKQVSQIHLIDKSIEHFKRNLIICQNTIFNNKKSVAFYRLKDTIEYNSVYFGQPLVNRFFL